MCCGKPYRNSSWRSLGDFDWGASSLIFPLLQPVTNIWLLGLNATVWIVSSRFRFKIDLPVVNVHNFNLLAREVPRL